MGARPPQNAQAERVRKATAAGDSPWMALKEFGSPGGSLRGFKEDMEGILIYDFLIFPGKVCVSFSNILHITSKLRDEEAVYRQPSLCEAYTKE